MKRLAAAFAMLATPALSAPCETVRAEFKWDVFTITQTADTVNRKLCLSFATDNENIKEVLIKITDDTTGISTMGTEGCLDLMGSPTQGLTPMVVGTNGEVVNLATLRLPQAMEVYQAMVAGCAVHPSSYEKINFMKFEPRG